MHIGHRAALTITHNVHTVKSLVATLSRWECSTLHFDLRVDRSILADGSTSTLSLAPGLPRHSATMSPSSSSNPRVWDAQATQQQFMERDECIVVDETDTVIGQASKGEAHRFDTTRPSGLLHRAFSVFLFDDEDRLLLQQRALNKITFPGVWTNTCCSHPLHGYEPSEVDSPGDVANGSVMGAKRAAVRKLGQELGIPEIELPLEKFQFLTRLHYCARDIDTHGPDSEWGEHEIDYILLVRAGKVTLKPNLDEVADTKYVTQQELVNMMDPQSGLRWSPWFRIIAKTWLQGWWSDLNEALCGSEKHVDLEKIHKIL